MASILIVDDQAGIRRLLTEVLKGAGYKVYTAANGYEAIEVVRRTELSLILMDMKMLGMNGLETLCEVRKIRPDVLVIMMTAYGELEMVQEAMALGAKRYIAKPFDINVLKTIIAEVLNNGRGTMVAEKAPRY